MKNLTDYFLIFVEFIFLYIFIPIMAIALLTSPYFIYMDYRSKEKADCSVFKNYSAKDIPARCVNYYK